MKTRWLLAALTLLLIPGAQGSDGRQRAVEWQLSLARLAGAAAGELELVATVTIQPPWHVYGKDGGPAGQAGLSFGLTLPRGIEAVGDWRWPPTGHPAESGGDGFYEGTQDFQRKLRVVGAEPGAELRLTIAYQACTEEMCAAPAVYQGVVRMPGPKDEVGGDPERRSREEAEDYAAFVVEFRETHGRAARLETVDWSPLERRFAAHLARFPDCEILGKRATDFLGTLGISAPEEARKAWQHLAEVANATPDAPGMKAVAAAAARQLELAEVIQSGRQLESVRFTAVDGRRVDLPAMKGKVVLIDFWASWCRPCVDEIPVIRAVYEKYHPDGFEVIGICCDRGDRARLVEFLRKNGCSWPQFFDGGGLLTYYAQVFQVNAWPTSILVGRDGSIVARDVRGEALGPAVAAALGR